MFELHKNKLNDYRVNQSMLVNFWHIQHTGMTMRRTYTSAIILSFIVLTLTACSGSETMNEYTQQAQSSRTPAFIDRDKYRNPNETLAFFEITKQQTVVEIWPGGAWYAEILAPFLKNEGQYYAAHFDKNSEVGFFTRMREKFDEKVKTQPEVYANTITTSFEPPHVVDIAPQASADRVLTFRNVHNWMRNNSEQAAFDSFYKALKPGGKLGVVEHRAPESFTLDQMITTGYVSEAYVKQLAKKSGFIFESSSEVNANKLDTKSHPKGVWTLPPSLRLGDKDKTKYLSIGESDRMTLKFIKPSAS